MILSELMREVYRGGQRSEFRFERTIKLIPTAKKTTAIAKKVLLVLMPIARKVIARAINAKPAFFVCFIHY